MYSDNDVAARVVPYLNNIVEIVFTQMTKTRGFSAMMRRNHVSDLYLIVDHQHSVDQQFHQSPFLHKSGIG